MATAEFFSAARSQEIEDSAIVGGTINGSGHLILSRHDGGTIDAGSALVAVPPEQLVHFLNPSGFSNATSPIDYPDGISIMYISDTESTADWPPFAGTWGSLQTVNYTATYSDADTTQVWTKLHGSGTTPEKWMRSGNYGSWSDWVKIAVDTGINLVKTPSVTPNESYDHNSYTGGISLYKVTTGSGWTPESGIGNILTVMQDSGHLFQMFVKANGGSSVTPNVYFRTYKSPSGWTNWGKVALTSDTTTLGILGEIKMWATASAPNGWMLCEGGAISRTTYADLFALIGTNFGVGDGSTTFNVPDFRGRFPVGFNTSDTDFNSRGKTGGEKTHVLTTAEMPSHNHTQASHTHTMGGSGALTDGGTGTTNYSLASGATYTFRTNNTGSATPAINNTGGDGAHNNLPPYLAIKFIIKLTV